MWKPVFVEKQINVHMKRVHEKEITPGLPCEEIFSVKFSNISEKGISFLFLRLMCFTSMLIIVGCVFFMCFA